MMMEDQGKLVNWVDIMFKQLHKELIKWLVAQTNMLQGYKKV